MKKAKIMLTAVGLLAVVGGALAFKAHRVSGKLFCSTTTSPAALCTITATTIENAQTVHNIYCTTDIDASCDVRFQTAYLKN